MRRPHKHGSSAQCWRERPGGGPPNAPGSTGLPRPCRRVRTRGATRLTRAATRLLTPRPPVCNQWLKVAGIALANATLDADQSVSTLLGGI